MKKYNVYYKIKGVGEGVTCIEADNDIEAENILVCRKYPYEDIEIQQVTRAYNHRSEDDD